MSSSITQLDEQLCCAVCLQVFTKPVTIPCGHTFCQTCITHCWARDKNFSCPMCMVGYSSQPMLKVNTVLAGLADQLKEKPGLVSGRKEVVKAGEVPCDVCVGSKSKAVHSCLMCLVSYCKAHVEPHERVASLKNHTLTLPMKNLEHRVCQKHNRVLQLYCKTDCACICELCAEQGHKGHDMLSTEIEGLVRKVEARQRSARVKRMIQDRKKKLKGVRHTLALEKFKIARSRKLCHKAFSTVRKVLEKRKLEMDETFEHWQKAAEQQARGRKKDLKKQIAELKKKSGDLEHFLGSSDHFHVIRNSSAICTLPIPRWIRPAFDQGWNAGMMETHLRTITKMEKDLGKEMVKFRENEQRLMHQS